MSIQRTCVADGVFLTTIPTDRFKTDRLQLLFSLPLDPKNIANGTLLCNVLRENCKKYPTQALLSKRLEQLYDASLSSVLAADGDQLQIGMVVDILDNAYATDGTDILQGALDVLTEILLRPNVTDGAFDAVCLAREQKNACDEIAAQINNKMRYVLLRLRALMFAGEPFALSAATEEGIYAVTPASLYDFYRELLRTATVEIFYAGTPHDALLQTFASNLFADVDRVPASVTVTKPHIGAKKVQRITETLPVRQGKLCMGFAGAATLTDPDYPASILFRTIYGSSPVSKLFMNVREKLSLCYYCHAIAYSDKGALVVSSGVENEKREAAEAEILAQLAEIANGSISEEELSVAKKFAVSACRTVSDSTGGLIQWYSKRAPLGITQTPEELIRLLSALDTQTIAAYAKRLTPDTFYFLSGTLPTDTDDEEDA